MPIMMYGIYDVMCLLCGALICTCAIPRFHVTLLLVFLLHSPSTVPAQPRTLFGLRHHSQLVELFCKLRRQLIPSLLTNI